MTETDKREAAKALHRRISKSYLDGTPLATIAKRCRLGLGATLDHVRRCNQRLGCTLGLRLDSLAVLEIFETITNEKKFLAETIRRRRRLLRAMFAAVHKR